MSVRAVIRSGIADLGIEDAYVEAVSRLEGWSGTPRTRRIRVMQALSEHHERHLDVVWAQVAVRVLTFHGREDLADAIVGAFHEAKYEGRREREAEDELLAKHQRRGPYRAQPPTSTARKERA